MNSPTLQPDATAEMTERESQHDADTNEPKIAPAFSPPPTMSFETDLLLNMFKGDLDLAAQFARIGHYSAARQALESAVTKLGHLEALPKSGRAVPALPPPAALPIDV